MIDKDYIKTIVNAQNQKYIHFNRFVIPKQLLDKSTKLITKKTCYKKFVEILENENSVYCSKTGTLTLGSKHFVLFITDCFKHFNDFDKIKLEPKYNIVSIIHTNDFLYEYFVQLSFFDDSNIRQVVDEYVELNKKCKDYSHQQFEYHVQREIIENYFNKFAEGKTQKEINEMLRHMNRLNYCIKNDFGAYTVISLSNFSSYVDEDLKWKSGKKISYSVSSESFVDFSDASIDRFDNESFRKMKNIVCSIFFEKDEQHCFSNYEEKCEYFQKITSDLSKKRQSCSDIIVEYSQKQLEKIVNDDCIYTKSMFSPCVTLFDKIKVYFDVEKDPYFGNNIPRFTCKSIVEKNNWLDYVVE